MDTKELFKEVLLNLYRKYNETWENTDPTKEMSVKALAEELDTKPKETLVKMLSELIYEVGSGNPNAEFIEMSDELAAQLEKEEKEKNDAKAQGQNS